jgi:uncharacterized membrane protein (GlpM family)
MQNKRRNLILIGFIPLVPSLGVCLVVLFRTSPNPVKSLIDVGMFAIAVVILNVTAIRIARAKSPHDASREETL